MKLVGLVSTSIAWLEMSDIITTQTFIIFECLKWRKGFDVGERTFQLIAEYISNCQAYQLIKCVWDGAKEPVMGEIQHFQVL